MTASTSACAVALALAISLCCVSAASPTSLLGSAGPGSSGLYVFPPKYNHTAAGPIGGPSPCDWGVAQWSIPHSIPLEPTVGTQGPCSRPGVEWYVANANMRVCMYKAASNGQHAVELAQSGTTGLQCGLELDSFLSPMNPGTYNGVPVGMQPSKALDQVSALNLTFGFDLVYSAVSDRCGTRNQCGGSGHVDYGYATAALTLDNHAKQQSLFYQILLFDTRSSSQCDFQPCEARRSWFFKSQPYGVSDSIGSFGQACITKGGQGRVLYNLDVLPKLVSAIRTPPSSVVGLDSDISDWYVSGMYIGLGLQGSTVQTCIVDSVDFLQTEM